MRRLTRRIHHTPTLLLACAVAVAGFGVSACHRDAPSAEAEADTPSDSAAAAPVSVRVEPARLEALQAKFVVTGTVVPAAGTDWTIAAPEAGVIAELGKAEGDTVAAGDLLVRFEIASVQTEALARKNDLTKARARADAARKNAARLTDLLSRGIVPSRDVEDARRELQDAEIAEREAESGQSAAALSEAQNIVKARFPGVVAKLWHAKGDAVKPADDPIMRVIDPQRLEIAASVPMDQLAAITPGRPATIFNPADGSPLVGQVVARNASDPTAAAGEIRISAGANAGKLTLNAPIQAEISSEERGSALTVASDALHRDQDGTFVMVAVDGHAQRRAVQVGLIAQGRTQILSGIVAGDPVVLSGASPVPDGASIVVKPAS